MVVVVCQDYLNLCRSISASNQARAVALVRRGEGRAYLGFACGGGASNDTKKVLGLKIRISLPEAGPSSRVEVEHVSN